MSAAPLPKRRDIRDLSIMAASRVTQLRNLVDQQLRESPWRTLSVIGLLGLIWVSLYGLLEVVFRHVRNWDLIGIVADQHIFAHFFLVLAIMLAFSNGVLTFGSLYGRDEAGHLLSLPVQPRAVVCAKWLEGMLLSSWSFVLLGVPLMLAVAASSDVRWYYYPLFLAHFIGFVAIPACIGLLAAWAVAMWAPRRPMSVATGGACVVVLLITYWFSQISQHALVSDEWLRAIFDQIGAVKHPLLPSTWTAKGVVAAMRQRVDESLFYLAVVLANAAFLSWLTVNLLGRHWADAFSRAQQGRYHPTIRRGWFTEALCVGLFFYLPSQLRWVMLKDIRGFARDAKQWSQMAIMFGLLIIYALNLTRIPLDRGEPYTQAVFAFLNLTTVSLILATFTSRFIYPLISLESQQLWLIEILPLRRRHLLLVKFLFALTMTAIAAMGVMWMAVTILQLPLPWARVNLAVCLAVCVGLSGLSIGLGARFPELGHRNPARIAAGFGGTINLIASMLFVSLEMAGVAWLCAREMNEQFRLPEAISWQGWQLLVALLGLSILTAGFSLWVGGRHFEKLEH